jgi:hypothetical protein
MRATSPKSRVVRKRQVQPVPLRYLPLTPFEVEYLKVVLMDVPYIKMKYTDVHKRIARLLEGEEL